MRLLGNFAAYLTWAAVLLGVTRAYRQEHR